ncbi:unnamed protein product [Arabidopsis halleri]
MVTNLFSFFGLMEPFQSRRSSRRLYWLRLTVLSVTVIGEKWNLVGRKVRKMRMRLWKR